MRKLCYVIVFFCIFCSDNCLAQKRNEFGFVAGDSYYLGELNPGTQFVNNKLTFGMFYKRNIGERISVRLSGNYASLSGNDTIRSLFGNNVGEIDRKGEFKSNIVDLNAICEINFLNYFIGASKYFWTPYMLMGVGATYQVSLEGSFIGESKNSSGYYTNYVTDMKGIYTTSDPGTILMNKSSDIAVNVCFGFGFKYSFSERVGVFGEWVMHKTFCDWLDGFYFDKNYEVNLSNYDYAHICNTATLDWYSYLELGVSFAFNLSNKNDCYDHLRK